MRKRTVKIIATDSNSWKTYHVEVFHNNKHKANLKYELAEDEDPKLVEHGEYYLRLDTNDYAFSGHVDFGRRRDGYSEWLFCFFNNGAEHRFLREDGREIWDSLIGFGFELC